LDRPGGVDRAALRLRDDETRAAFDERLARFLGAMERVLPHEDALPYVADAQRWSLLQQRARRLWRDVPGGDFSLRGYGRKVRAMIADHLRLPEIHQEVVPVFLTDPTFDAAVERIAEKGETELAAAEQVQALRYHLQERERRERPEVYRRLSEALEDVLSEFDGQWEEIRRRLGPFIDEARRQEEADPAVAGLSGVERLLYAQLSDGLRREGGPFAETDVSQDLLRVLSVELCGTITGRVALASFGNRQEHLTQLESAIFQTIRRVAREAGLPRPDTDAARRVARLLTGHVQDHLAQYQRAGGAVGN
jgi:type I restriction enzyme R subunit